MVFLLSRRRPLAGPEQKSSLLPKMYSIDYPCPAKRKRIGPKKIACTTEEEERASAGFFQEKESKGVFFLSC